MRFALAVTSAVVALALLAPEARAQNDVTGSYVGRVTCKDVGPDGQKVTHRLVGILHASQPAADPNGADVQIFTQVFDPSTGALVGQHFWFGRSIFDSRRPDSKGVGAAKECSHVLAPGAGADYQMMKFDYNVNPANVRGTFKFTSIGDFDGSDRSIGTCKGRLKMVSVLDLGVPLCP
jgi:hypothetical protein